MGNNIATTELHRMVLGALLAAGRRFDTSLVGGLSVAQISRITGLTEVAVRVSLDHMLRRDGVMCATVDGLADASTMYAHTLYYLKPGNWNELRPA
jgi:hypothetical protein